jgi:glycosyltransferase involved in cell wall biosynthesis
MVLQHSQNRGKGAAIWNGLCRLFSDHGHESNWIAIMDADGQHDPEDLAVLVECARSNPDLRMVVGSRMSDPGSMPIIRYWTNRFTSYRISKLAGQSIPDSQCGYRLIHRDILKVWRPTVFHFDSETEMLIHASRGGLKIGCARVRTLYPDGMRPSRIHPARDTFRYFRMMHRLKQEVPDMHRDGNS